MPLLAQDKNGRVYQTEGLSEHGDTAVGYYAELGDEDSVYFGDLSPKALKNRKIFHARQKHRAMMLRKEQNRRKAIAMKQAQAKAAQETAAKQRIEQIQAKKRRVKNMKLLARINAGRAAFAGYDQQTVGNPLSGWEDGAAIMKPNDWRKHDLAGVNVVEEYGYGNYHQVEHPLMGHSFRYNGDMDGMGFKKLKKLVKKVVPKAVSKAVKDVSKVAGKVVNAPLKLAHQVVTNVPLVKDVYKGVDKLTGGTLTSLHRTVLLPGQALQGQKITKAMFVESLMNVIKIGAIVVTGGSAAAVIGAAAGALKQGPLGKTSLGRSILSVAEVAGLAYAGGQAMSKVLEKKALDTAAAKASSEAGKKLGVLGAIAASAAVTAGYSGLGGGAKGVEKASESAAKNAAESANKAGEIAAKEAVKAAAESGMKFDSQAAMAQFQDEARKAAEKQVAMEFQKKTGIPLDVAMNVANGNVPTPEQLKAKISNEFFGTIDDLENRANQILQQIPTSEPQFKALLEQKQMIFAEEIAKRKLEVERVTAEAGEELAAANRLLVERGQVAGKIREEMEALGKEYDILAAKMNASNANLAERGILAEKMAALQAKITAMAPAFEAAATEAELAKVQADHIEDVGAIKVVQTELGGHGARDKYIPSEADIYVHPMLRYNLIQPRMG